ncbi:MAG: tyrosine-type recombinase/integrase [Ornithinimicrobium sp.]|uniref:tyrosine-type recombinase/integrase n=1 Tax=Ornithinimicrobium sp. TaxID=1977084 RepID=UPI003D9B30B3
MGRPSRVRVTGPLAPHAAGFGQDLAGQGYTPHSASYQLQLMAHASRWLASRGLGVEELTAVNVEAFLEQRRAEGYRLWLSAKAMAPMLGYLRGLGVVATPAATVPVTPAAELQQRYRAYLIHERGLADSTVAGYLHVARLFLAGRVAEDVVAVERLCSAEVTAFVLAECAARSVGSAKYIVCGLRALLRYLYVAGHTDIQLPAAVPAVAGWRCAAVPATVGPAEVACLLASCDRRTTSGRRDYAVLALLARLGLRAGEVAALELADVDWRAGEITVRGKGRRQERLPLPVDVGEALAGWLRRGRRRCACVTVFTRVRAPHRPLSRGGVSAIVRAACGRAGLPELGAHRLRHTAATDMLRAGASLSEVGQVLRHTSTVTTAVYAKVDTERLRSLALRWPGTAS